MRACPPGEEGPGLGLGSAFGLGLGLALALGLQGVAQRRHLGCSGLTDIGHARSGHLKGVVLTIRVLEPREFPVLSRNLQ